jgi:hypothetical protein
LDPVFVPIYTAAELLSAYQCFPLNAVVNRYSGIVKLTYYLRPVLTELMAALLFPLSSCVPLLEYKDTRSHEKSLS